MTYLVERLTENGYVSTSSVAHGADDKKPRVKQHLITAFPYGHLQAIDLFRCHVSRRIDIDIREIPL